MLTTLALIAAGGACGAVARFAAVNLSAHAGVPLPWGTFAVNLAGCFAIGLVMGHWAETEWFRTYGRAFVVVGLLGGFTTFSAFSLETVLLVEENQWPTALAYVAASVVTCVAAAWAGQYLATSS